MKKKVVVFAPNAEGKVIRRIRAFRDNDFEVICLSYRRNRYNQNYKPEWENIHLGDTQAQQYIRRSLGMFRIFWILFKARKRIRDATVFFAINLDLAVLAFSTRFICGKKIPIVYEVADIQPIMVQNNLQGKLFRFVQRRILKRIHLLVVTSPGFVKHYFLPTQNYTGKWFVLEHKLYPPFVPIKRKNERIRTENDKWVIGHFGILKCIKSWRLIKQIAKALPEQVEFYVRGYLDQIDEADFSQSIAEIPNIKYGGSYATPDDLTELYDRIDLVWCFDFVNEQHNSKWCLPNRLHEGGHFGVPMLASKGYQVGNYIEDWGIGWTFEEPCLKNLVNFLRGLTVEKYQKVKNHYNALPESQFAGTEDFSRMCDMILDAIHQSESKSLSKL